MQMRHLSKNSGLLWFNYYGLHLLAVITMFYIADFHIDVNMGNVLSSTILSFELHHDFPA